MAHRLAGGILRDHLRRVSRALARAFEANFARARPADHVAFQIGDRDDGVVKRRENVRETGVNVFAPFRLDDFRFLDVVRIERKIFLRRFGALRPSAFSAFGAAFFFGFGAASARCAAAARRWRCGFGVGGRRLWRRRFRDRRLALLRLSVASSDFGFGVFFTSAIR